MRIHVLHSQTVCRTHTVRECSTHSFEVYRTAVVGKVHLEFRMFWAAKVHCASVEAEKQFNNPLSIQCSRRAGKHTAKCVNFVLMAM